MKKILLLGLVFLCCLVAIQANGIQSMTYGCFQGNLLVEDFFCTDEKPTMTQACFIPNEEEPISPDPDIPVVYDDCTVGVVGTCELVTAIGTSFDSDSCLNFNLDDPWCVQESYGTEQVNQWFTVSPAGSKSCEQFCNELGYESKPDPVYRGLCSSYELQFWGPNEDRRGDIVIWDYQQRRANAPKENAGYHCYQYDGVQDADEGDLVDECYCVGERSITVPTITKLVCTVDSEQIVSVIHSGTLNTALTTSKNGKTLSDTISKYVHNPTLRIDSNRILIEQPEIAHGDSQTFYNDPFSFDCLNTANIQERSCSDGTLSGSFAFANCVLGKTQEPVTTNTCVGDECPTCIQTTYGMICSSGDGATLPRGGGICGGDCTEMP